VEGKSWLAQTEQAKLYFNQAQNALESVKVSTIPFLKKDANTKLYLVHQRYVDEAIQIRGRKEHALVSHSGSYSWGQK
jgi:hypothetical protein